MSARPWFFAAVLLAASSVGCSDDQTTASWDSTIPPPSDDVSRFMVRLVGDDGQPLRGALVALDLTGGERAVEQTDIRGAVRFIAPTRDIGSVIGHADGYTFMAVDAELIRSRIARGFPVTMQLERLNQAPPMLALYGNLVAVRNEHDTIHLSTTASSGSIEVAASGDRYHATIPRGEAFYVTGLESRDAGRAPARGISQDFVAWAIGYSDPLGASINRLDLDFAALADDTAPEDLTRWNPYAVTRWKVDSVSGEVVPPLDPALASQGRLDISVHLARFDGRGWLGAARYVDPGNEGDNVTFTVEYLDRFAEQYETLMTVSTSDEISGVWLDGPPHPGVTQPLFLTPPRVSSPPASLHAPWMHGVAVDENVTAIVVQLRDGDTLLGEMRAWPHTQIAAIPRLPTAAAEEELLRRTVSIDVTSCTMAAGVMPDAPDARCRKFARAAPMVVGASR